MGSEQQDKRPRQEYEARCEHNESTLKDDVEVARVRPRGNVARKNLHYRPRTYERNYYEEHQSNGGTRFLCDRSTL